MQISSFYNPTKYNPVAYRNHNNKLILGPKVRRVVRSMWWYDQAAIAEKMSRSMIKHSFYAVKRGHGIEPVRDLTDDTVPILKAVCSTTKAQAELSENIDELLEFGFTYRIQQKIQYHFPIPKLAPILVAFFDGSHTVREIVDEVKLTTDASEEVVLNDLHMLVWSLHGMGKLALATEKVHRHAKSYYEGTPFGSCRWFGDWD